jgi:hypothetical protein
MPKFHLTIHETMEFTHTITANSEAEAREEWEHTVVADYNGGDEECIFRGIVKISEEPTC